MSMPFYVSPEQLMKDRADFARKGIARGRSMVAVQYADGILFASENPSQALHKVSEIYDRIAFAAVGRYNEFENLRIAGVRLADMRGYAYDRRDVTGARAGQRLRPDARHDLLQRRREALRGRDLRRRDRRRRVGRPDLPAHLRRAGRRRARLRRDGRRRRRRGGLPVRSTTARAPRSPRRSTLAVAALGRSTNERGEPDDRVIPVKDLEVAVLDRTRAQPRKFSRLASAPARGAARRPRARPPPTRPRRAPSTAPGTAATDAQPRRPEGPDRPGERRRAAAGGPGPGRPPAGGPTAARRGRVGRQAGLGAC